MKRIIFFFLLVYIPVVIFASTVDEQNFNLDEDIKYKQYNYVINLDYLKVTENYYFLTIYFNNFSTNTSKTRYKVLFNIEVNC